jgi:hypothetical protein
LFGALADTAPLSWELAMRLSTIIVVFSVLCVPMTSTPIFGQETTIEENTDRGGSDYRDFDMRTSDFLFCQAACYADRTCVAWTFVREGIQGPAPRCWLKNRMPEPRADACCVSGIVR